MFAVDPEAGELRKHGLRIRLAAQPLAILVTLLERPGQLVTRDELQRTLWAADTFVDFERGLNKAINRLRDALGDAADEPRFIATVPRRGYRFIGQIDALPVIEEAPVAVEAVAVERPAATLSATVPPRTGWWAYALLAVVLLVALASLRFFVWPRPAIEVEPLLRSSLLPPADSAFVPYQFAVSPDGAQLAFVARGNGGQRLWLRSLGAATAQPLSGTENASFPFWAPDGRRLGFFADRKLKILEADRTVRVLVDVKRPSGASWSANGIIVFAPDVSGPMYAVADTGGSPSTVTRVSDARETHRWPTFLPDGRHFLYIADNSRGDASARGIFAASLDSTLPIHVSAEPVRNVAVALDHLFFVRGGTLMAQPLDTARVRTSGPARAVAEREVASASAFFPSGFSIANTGLLAFQSSADLASRLVWFDGSGKEVDALPSGAYSDPSVSPDGRSVVMSCDQLGNGTSSICVYDTARRLVSRLTTGTDDRFPVWSPDGREIVYASGDGSYRVAADGSTAAQRISTRNNPSSWSATAGVLSFGTDAGIVSLALTSVDDAIVDLGEGSEGQFSPDGRWIAHNGPDGVVVRSFPGPGTRLQVSGYGGHQPRWSRDGRQLFYVALDKTLMAVAFDAATATAGAPRPLFRTRIVAPAFIGFQYDVAPGGRFLINVLESEAPPLTLLTGWSAALSR